MPLEGRDSYWDDHVLSKCSNLNEETNAYTYYVPGAVLGNTTMHKTR